MPISAWNINVREGHSSRGLICQPGFQLYSNAGPSSQAWSRQMNLHQSCSLRLLPFLSHSSYERATNQGAPSPPPVAGTLFARITGEMEPVSDHIANKEAYQIFMPYRGAFNRWSNRVMIPFEAIDVLRHGMCRVCYLVLGKWKTQLGEVETAWAITFFISTIYQKCHMTPLCLCFWYLKSRLLIPKKYVKMQSHVSQISESIVKSGSTKNYVFILMSSYCQTLMFLLEFIKNVFLVHRDQWCQLNTVNVVYEISFSFFVKSLMFFMLFEIVHHRWFYSLFDCGSN